MYSYKDVVTIGHSVKFDVIYVPGFLAYLEIKKKKNVIIVVVNC
jgi:hypothetical protein